MIYSSREGNFPQLQAKERLRRVVAGKYIKGVEVSKEEAWLSACLR